jgi:predicted ATPase
VIESILIDGYKCLRESTPLSTSNLNVLVGSNGAGKSSVLQTLLLLRQSAEKDGIVKDLHLSGPLYEGGTAKDVLHPAAEHQIKVTLKSDDVDVSFSFLYSREENSDAPTRLLKANSAGKLPESLFQKNSVFGYINAERLGPRVTYSLPPDDLHLSGVVGKYGEYTTAVLARAANRPYGIDGWPTPISGPDIMGVILNQTPQIAKDLANAVMSIDGLDLEKKIFESAGRLDLLCNVMLGWIIPGASFKANENAQTDSAMLEYIRDPNQTKTSVRATHTGFGLTYTLPIIAATLSLDKNGLLLIENPEAHLHPFSQSRIGAFLAIMAATGRQIFIETHSDHVINGIRLAIRKKLIQPEMVFINFFQRQINDEKSTITQIRPDATGRLDRWPSGFLDQIENDLSQL